MAEGVTATVEVEVTAEGPLKTMTSQAEGPGSVMTMMSQSNLRCVLAISCRAERPRPWEAALKLLFFTERGCGAASVTAANAAMRKEKIIIS